MLRVRSAHMADETHIEIPAEKARQAGKGTHVFVIWALSTLAVAVGLFAMFAMSAVSTGPAP